MAHVMKYSEWQCALGWRAGDVTDLAHNSNYWGYPAIMLGISLTDYILLLKNKFNAKNFVYVKDKNLLFWYWENYIDCHNFILFVNKTAKRTRFVIC